MQELLKRLIFDREKLKFRIVKLKKSDCKHLLAALYYQGLRVKRFKEGHIGVKVRRSLGE